MPRTRVVAPPGTRRTTTREAPPKEGANPLFGVALLKLALELKKPGARPFDELVTAVLGRMRLDEAEFRAFLTANGGLLRTLGRGR